MREKLARFQQGVAERHEYARSWKARTKGKVVGYLCTHVPEEILQAAGMLPVRVLGGHAPQDVTKPHIFSMFCAYCQDVLAQGLLGKYAYLDGIVFAHCCPHIRQTYESWRRHIPLPFHHLLWVPSQQGRSARSFFAAEVREFKEAVEQWTGALISLEELKKAIEGYNLNRRLLQQVYELRKQDPPALSGAEALAVVLSSALMSKEEHSLLLQELLSGPSPSMEDPIGASPSQGNGSGTRLLVTGSENDDIGLIQLIESLGSVVVMEENCAGNRYFWNEVKLGGDLLSALADRYLDKPPCPLRDISIRQRTDYLVELAREYQAQGVIFLRQKFCDPHAYEVPAITKRLASCGLPCLVLELDVTVPQGQYRTRVEAFLEMLQN